MREVLIELRKYAGTRGGRTVLIAVAALTAGLSVVGAVVATGAPLSLSGALAFPMTLLEIALPLVVLLLWTTEWSTRDVVQTFVFRPRRGQVLASKSVAALVLVVAGLGWGVATSLLAVGARAVLTGTALSATGLVGTPGTLTSSALTVGLYALFGAAIGLLVARTAPALVVFLITVAVLDTLLTLALGERSVWISLGQAVSRLTAGGLTAVDLPSLATALVLWIVAPVVIGGVTFLRREAR
jgi:hypothetical protein